jgi:hypothetical protein
VGGFFGQFRTVKLRNSALNPYPIKTKSGKAASTVDLNFFSAWATSSAAMVSGRTLISNRWHRMRFEIARLF